jgi:hypothetical protein
MCREVQARLQVCGVYGRAQLLRRYDCIGYLCRRTCSKRSSSCARVTLESDFKMAARSLAWDANCAYCSNIAGDKSSLLVVAIAHDAMAAQVEANSLPGAPPNGSNRWTVTHRVRSSSDRFRAFRRTAGSVANFCVKNVRCSSMPRFHSLPLANNIGSGKRHLDLSF